MVTLILLAAALAGPPDSVHYRAVVGPQSAVFEFPVQYDTAWTLGHAAAPVSSPAYEWTVSTVVRDTVFSFGYLLFPDSAAAAPARAIRFADARSRLGERRLFANGAVDRTVVVDVAFEAERVVVRLTDAATIRRVFALRPQRVQFSYRLPGRPGETADVAVEYAEGANVADASTPAPAQQPGDFADSTYLRLVLDLPVMLTFSYDVVTRDRVTNVYSEIRDADVKGCLLSFRIWTQQFGQGVQTRMPHAFFTTAVVIPLDAINPKSLSIRAAHPQVNSRYEPQPWFLHIGLRPDSESRIAIRDIERGSSRGSRNIELTVKDYETAAVLKGWLSDGAHRCSSWRTAPLKPIR